MTKLETYKAIAATLKANGNEMNYLPLQQEFGQDHIYHLYNQGVITFEGEGADFTVVLIDPDKY